MNLKEKITIENNIVKYEIKAQYNDELTAEEELEIETLHDYIRKIRFSDIDFTANITLDNGTPIITDDNISETVVEISLGKVPEKEYILDENLNIVFSIDSGRVSDAEINDVLNSKPLVSQAKMAVFQFRILEKIKELLAAARNEDNDFEKETETIL
ncbi:hypothetical protein C823_007602 [Eubacterium plexicaudatum ASF492]|uniref:Uncharacterized protein n=1 Tax=Eubacterium plexicaudatum ASF492 TaxID=1235802 RepID=N2A4M5_9FIRM|nr:hypothetical protein C823_007602 [Eubacterium plexicaudatum ASF492]